MWIRKHESFYKNLRREDVWNVLIDVNHWHLWQDDLDYCRLDGEFKVGNHFLLKPKGVKPVKIDLIDIKDGFEFTDLTHFWGAEMFDTHQLEEKDGGLLIRHKVTVKGPLKWLWIFLVAGNIAKTAHEQTESLVKFVKSHHA